MRKRQEVEQRKRELLAMLLGQTAAIWLPWRYSDKDGLRSADFRPEFIEAVHADYPEFGFRWRGMSTDDKQRMKTVRDRAALAKAGMVFFESVNKQLSYIRLLPEALAEIRPLCGESFKCALWEMQRIRDLMNRHKAAMIDEKRLAGGKGYATGGSKALDIIARKLIPAIADGFVRVETGCDMEVFYGITDAGKKWMRAQAKTQGQKHPSSAGDAALKRIYQAASVDYRAFIKNQSLPVGYYEMQQEKNSQDDMDAAWFAEYYQRHGNAYVSRDY